MVHTQIVRHLWLGKAFTTMLVMAVGVHDVDGCSDRLVPGKISPTLYRETRVAVMSLCSRLCWYSTSCRSCSWGTRTRLCQLSKDTRDSNPDSFSVIQRHVYMELKGTPCVGTTHPCASRPCAPQSVCVPTEASKSYICLHMDYTPFPSAVETTTTTSAPASTSTPTPTTTTTTAPPTVPATTSSTSTTITIPSTTSEITDTATPTTTSTTSAPATTIPMTSSTSSSTSTSSVAPVITSQSTTTIISTTTTSSTSSTTTSTTTTTSSSSSTTTTTTTTTTVPAKSIPNCITSCTGLDGAFYHSCTTCSEYIRCTHGQMQIRPCSSGLEFNDNVKVCVHAPSPTCN